MRTNTLVTLGASAAFGIMAIVLARGWINEAIQSEFAASTPQTLVQTAARVKTVPVIVADSGLGFGDTLTAQALRIVDMPEDAVPEGAFSNFDALFSDPSQRTVVLSRMAMNEAVLDFKISGPGGRGSLSALIGEGMRATAIRVNDVAGVAGFVMPGDYVDVIFTRDKDAKAEDPVLLSDVILQNIRVLGVDQNLDQDTSAPNVVKTVTVEVSNHDAQRLHLAMDKGRLSLTLRPVGEAVVDVAKSLTDKSVTGETVIKPRVSVRRQSTPSKPATSQTAEITIIRGETVDQVNVSREVMDSAQTPKVDTDELAGG